MSTPSIQEIESLISQLREGKRRAVARLITHVENGGVDIAREIISRLFQFTGNGYVIGITGAPGSGKSTLTNRLAELLLSQGKKVGIICVDPTSPFSGGALLGDRIRMKENFTKQNLFIRSMANRGKLGGLARTTKEAIHILDAYGCDYILVETVGVGQSEIDIFKSAHTTLVIVVPTLGDDIQAIKAGIMEITDIFVVNKADLDGAKKKVNEIEAMLDLSEQLEVRNSLHYVRVHRKEGWRPPVVKTNALIPEGIDKLEYSIQEHRKYIQEHQLREKLNIDRYRHYIVEILNDMAAQNIEKVVYTEPAVIELLKKLFQEVSQSHPYSVAHEIFARFIQTNNHNPNQ